jgi:hypothetical protein
MTNLRPSSQLKAVRDSRAGAGVVVVGADVVAAAASKRSLKRSLRQR